MYCLRLVRIAAWNPPSFDSRCEGAVANDIQGKWTCALEGMPALVTSQPARSCPLRSSILGTTITLLPALPPAITVSRIGVSAKPKALGAPAHGRNPDFAPQLASSERPFPVGPVPTNVSFALGTSRHDTAQFLHGAREEIRHLTPTARMTPCCAAKAAIVYVPTSSARR